MEWQLRILYSASSIPSTCVVAAKDSHEDAIFGTTAGSRHYLQAKEGGLSMDIMVISWATTFLKLKK